MEHPRSGTEPERRRPPGMHDVARLAGVSQKTVSRVVNKERYVSAAAREKVLAAARELGYRPNTAARALITGRFQRIGVVSLGTALYGPTALLVALERATRAAGFSLIVANTAEGEPDSIQSGVDWLLEQGVDGVVLSEPIDEGQHLRWSSDVPVVSFGHAPGCPTRRSCSRRRARWPRAARPPNTSSTWATGGCGIWPARSGGGPPANASKAGGRPISNGASSPRRISKETGRPPPGTAWAGDWPPTPR
ncbi:hypothetical protein GCM10029992_42900 [Glycomyces albus]